MGGWRSGESDRGFTCAKQPADDFEIPLSREAVALLRELQKITGLGPHLFPGRGRSRVISENTLNTALVALGYHDQP